MYLPCKCFCYSYILDFLERAFTLKVFINVIKLIQKKKTWSTSKVYAYESSVVSVTLKNVGSLENKCLTKSLLKRYYFYMELTIYTTFLIRKTYRTQLFYLFERERRNKRAVRYKIKNGTVSSVLSKITLIKLHSVHLSPLEYVRRFAAIASW